MTEIIEDEEFQRRKAKLEQELKEDCLEPKELTYNEFSELLRLSYNDISETIKYYMDIPSEVVNIISLWIIGTYFHDRFKAYPYLFINAMRGSGKTRLLKITEAFSYQAQLTTLITEAVMFRTTGSLILDEFEGINRKGNENLRELLNSAYKKGTKVFRMKKKKTLEGESQVVEEFKPYRPVMLANIWGMEEVLGDRCINAILEKSSDLSKIKLVEDFDSSLGIKAVKETLQKLSKCSLCSVVSLNNVYLGWNNYIKQKYRQETTLNYTNTLTTLTTLTTLQQKANITEFLLENEGKDFFSRDKNSFYEKIDSAGVDGRHLELFFPLFFIASEIGEDILDKTISYSRKIVNDKKEEETFESKDAQLYQFVANQTKEWRDIKDITSTFRFVIGEESDWLNSKWLGRALKRLNLILEKRRLSSGYQVVLDIDKAKEKSKIFKPKEALNES